MKNIYLLLFGIFGVFTFAQSERTSDVISPKAQPKPIVYKYPNKAFVTLQDYYNAFNAENLINSRIYSQKPFLTDNISSQLFEAANTQYTANAADDFVVPANKVWNVTAVNAIGTLPSSNYPTSYNVTFYTNTASNLPGTVIRTETVTLAAGSGSPSLPLATPLSLTEGTYWISVQAVMDLSGGQWFWSTYNDAATLSQPYAWKNPGGGFGSTCTTSWNTGSICIAGQLKDLQFSLDGTESIPCKVFTGRILNTDPTHTPRITRDGVHSACGVAKVFPGNFGSGAFHYKSYAIQNTSASPDCVTLSLKNTDPDPLKQVHLMAYSGSFNAANISQNYLGDIGNSSVSGAVESMSVTVPGNTTIILIATEVTANTAFTADFTINVLSANCGTILKTIDSTNNNISIYPNPANKVLYVNGMKVKDAKVYDVSGKLIPVKNTENEITVEGLQKGNYLLQIQDKGGKVHQDKFIKN